MTSPGGNVPDVQYLPAHGPGGTSGLNAFSVKAEQDYRDEVTNDTLGHFETINGYGNDTQALFNALVQAFGGNIQPLVTLVADVLLPDWIDAEGWVAAVFTTLDEVSQVITGEEDGDSGDLSSWVNSVLGRDVSLAGRVARIENKIAVGAEFFEAYDRGDNDTALDNGWIQGGDGEPLGIHDQAAQIRRRALPDDGTRYAICPQAASGDDFTVAAVIHPAGVASNAETVLYARSNTALTAGVCVRLRKGSTYIARYTRSGVAFTYTNITPAGAKFYSNSATVEFKGQGTTLQVIIDTVLVHTVTDTTHTIGAANRTVGFSAQCWTGILAVPQYSGGLASFAVRSAVDLTAVAQAKSTADTALTNASTAQTTANTAKSTADAAQTTANTANTAAGTAQSTADTAAADALNAGIAANAASTNAATALSTANTKTKTTRASSAPSSPGVGDIWIDTALGDTKVLYKVWDGAAWQLTTDKVATETKATVTVLSTGSVLDTFTSGGTWTKRAGIKRVRVHIFGSGAGGAPGGITSSTIRIGTGGGIGGYTFFDIEASALGATEAVTVGTAGVGADYSYPNPPGTDGNTSTFATYSAGGGRAGAIVAPAVTTPGRPGFGSETAFVSGVGGGAGGSTGFDGSPGSFTSGGAGGVTGVTPPSRPSPGYGASGAPTPVGVIGLGSSGGGGAVTTGGAGAGGGIGAAPGGGGGGGGPNSASNPGGPGFGGGAGRVYIENLYS